MARHFLSSFFGNFILNFCLRLFDFSGCVTNHSVSPITYKLAEWLVFATQQQ